MSRPRSSQPGLSLAYRRGKLDGADTPALQMLKTGFRYQAAYEAAGGLRTPERHEIRSGDRTGPQEAAMGAALALKRLRAGLSADQLSVIDNVCGDGRTVYSTAQALKRHALTVERLLREALAIATANREAE